jgi:hypothetical protein
VLLDRRIGWDRWKKKVILDGAWGRIDGAQNEVKLAGGILEWAESFSSVYCFSPFGQSLLASSFSNLLMSREEEAVYRENCLAFLYLGESLQFWWELGTHMDSH